MEIDKWYGKKRKRGVVNKGSVNNQTSGEWLRTYRVVRGAGVKLKKFSCVAIRMRLPAFLFPVL